MSQRFKKPTGQMFAVERIRHYRFDDVQVMKYCKDHPFYQNHSNGVIIPTTPQLIMGYFKFRRIHGPEAVRAKFKGITDSLISIMQVYKPITYMGQEWWVPSVGDDI